ncbi:DUF3306 domain-containing protein (plasmid) [Sinorhizobium sp. M103]|uniref:DUF3306 domain-containing protein n=1 Tax=Sinorhizobium sp. M103 TaxID=2976821 RepID=UPI0023D8C6A2|nr:DUF3306 domain-containing protein [Sinorhizobium sp. M103]WEJ12100.1 DUF3306 domain-containing protein [Sinorhizobium sp. M103]
MSDGSDNHLARWSRRKLASRREQKPAAPELDQASGEVAENNDPVASCPERNQPAAEAAELEGVGVVEPLPHLEDLTAESDVAAFLKKGVPLALKHAALRKAWSLDPGIRDFVGPSEYAWDFNKPGSMGGLVRSTQRKPSSASCRKRRVPLTPLRNRRPFRHRNNGPMPCRMRPFLSRI